MLILKNLSALFSFSQSQMIDFPGLIRFVFFKGIKNAHPLRSAPSRQVCTSVNPAKRVAIERRRKSRSRRPRAKAPACAPSDSTLMVIVVYHSCRQKSSEKCRGVRSSGWGKKTEGTILRRRGAGPALPPARQSSPPSSSHLRTSTSQGDTMYLSNSTLEPALAAIHPMG